MELGSISIPKSVKSIGYEAFYRSGVNSISVPNSVTSIGEYAFSKCSKLKRIEWNTNVKVENLFDESDKIKEIIVGDDVNTVYPFNTKCSPTKIVLGENVRTICQNAFQNFCGEFCIHGMEPPHLSTDVFIDADLTKSTLYIPKDKSAYYTITAPWCGFGQILDLHGNESQPASKKCATPSIAFEDGKLYFATATPQADIYSNITSTDISSFSGTEVSLSATYIITAVAKRSEYLDSDVATATLHWVDGTLDDAVGTMQSFASKRALLVRNSNGNISISGLHDGEKVDAYTMDGKFITSVYAKSSNAKLSVTTADMVIIKIGHETIKTIVK